MKNRYRFYCSSGKSHQFPFFSQGLSLLETLIIIILILSALALGVPRFNKFIKFCKLKEASWTLVSDLRDYRLKAIVEHYRYEFVFNTDTDSYIVNRYTHPDSVFDGVMKTVNLELDIQQATDLTFLPAGNTTASSLITLQNTEGESSRIRVAPTTGHVTVE